MKFIAIDSSLANTGIAIGNIKVEYPKTIIEIESIHLVETKKSKHKTVRVSSDTIARGKQTYNFIQGFIKMYNPTVIFVETPSGSQTSSAMKSYGMTCQLIATLTPPPIEVTPHEVKMASVGKKTASKDEMIKWAEYLYPHVEWDKNKDGSLKNKNEHMADAIAIAHAGVRTQEFERIQSMLNA
jgi:Holliday junction resolvasome RuvABC endonuclease subunit